MTRAQFLLLAAAAAALTTPLRAAAPDMLPRLAVGGQLRMGFGGILLRAGLPFDYLTTAEQCDAKALARYDLVLIAAMDEGSEPWLPKCLDALDTYVAGGGRALLEAGLRPPRALTNLLASGTNHRGGEVSFALTGNDNPLAPLLPKGRVWKFHTEFERIAIPPGQYQVLADFRDQGIEGWPLLVARTVGRGRVVYEGANLAYLQGNWIPDFEDLFLAVVNWLTEGRARPQWAPPAEPVTLAASPAPDPAAPPAHLPQPGARDLGVAPVGGYCLRWQPAAGQLSRLYVDWPGGALLEASGGRIQARGGAPLNVAYDPQAEVVLERWPDVVAVTQHGAKLGWIPLPAAAGRRLYAVGGKAELQPVEPVLFGDDFTGDGHLSDAWQPRSGTWSLTGQTPSIARVPGFALHGEGGEVAAGAWYWSRYRTEASVRPLTANEVQLQACRADDANRLALRLKLGTKGEAALIQRQAGHDTVLAACTADLPRGQWLRLGLRRAAGRLVGSVDGYDLVQAPLPTAVLGGIGLAALGGAAVFDDIACVDESVVAAPHRVHPPTYDKGPSGLLDHDTWACAAAAWEPGPARGSFTHVGRFAGDLDLSLPCRPAGRQPQLALLAGSEREHLAPLLSVTGPHHGVSLHRRNGRWSAEVDGRPVAVPAGPAGSVCLGLSFQDLRLSPAELDVTAAAVSEYLFDRAPTDWWEASGEWDVASRWTCQPQWSWLAGGRNDGPAVLWRKRATLGDLVAQVPLGPKMHGSYGEPGSEPFERLRLSICGDGVDPWSGYTLEVGTTAPGHCRLYRGKTVAASAADLLPWWREIHNSWFDLRLERRGAALTAWFHNRKLFTWVDPQPLGDGKVCVWTERNYLVTPYVAVYGREGD